MTANFERNASPAHAIQRGLAYAEQRGFGINYKSTGELLRTTNCKLTIPRGRAAIGRGKGLEEQSLASAVFEAFEHYYHASEDLTSKIVSFEFDVCSDCELRHASPDFGLLFDNQVVPLSCLEFNGVDNAWHPIQFPAVLMNADYRAGNEEERKFIERTRIRRYATNSGTAAGLCKDEAILHGLLEVIERDAIGIAFVESVLSRPARPARVLQIDSLPASSSSIVAATVKESNGAIKLWDITSDVGIASVLCSLTVGTPPENRFFGSGTSLNPEYAVERAILEALQGFHIQTAFGVPIQDPMNRNVRRMSLFQRCQLGSGYFEYVGGETFSAFSDLPSLSRHSQAMTVPEQMKLVSRKLFDIGIKSYFREVHADEIFVMQVVAPRLERLYLLYNGLSVAPGCRGRAAKSRTARGNIDSQEALNGFVEV